MQRDPRILSVAEQLAAGHDVDWDQLGRSADADLMRELREIQKLSGAFRDQTPAPATASGERFAHLEILEVLGRGACGVVYRAYDPHLQRHVALKLTERGRSHRSLLREAQLMARVDHPHVLKVHGATEVDGRVGFWSDLIEGETLELWFLRQPPLSATELIGIGGELCAALAAMHLAGVIHGDLKPSNVVRQNHGRWVVIDFGSGQHTEDAGPVGGTPLYLAPELFAPSSADERSDQYALGVLLFRLATRRYPIEAETLEELEQQHQQGPQLSLLDLRPDLPRALIDAIEKALAPHPEDRHASVGAFAAALSRAAHQRGLMPATRPRLRRWLWAASAAGLMLAAAAWWRPASTDLLETEWLRTTGGVQSTLAAGDEVRLGDTLVLRLNLRESRYVYVVNVDQRGDRFQLFPLSGSELRNPLPAGQSQLPGRIDGRSLDWQITSRGGAERFFVLLANSPLSELDLAGFSQSSEQRSAETVQLLAGLGEPVRGVGGLSVGIDEEQDNAQTWLENLRRRHPEMEVHQMELRNP